MKLRFFAIVGIMVLTSLAVVAQETGPVISFEKTVHDFGVFLQKAGPQAYQFIFTNTGTTPIIIQKVTSSCGCTAPSWSKEPIAPGGQGFVEAIYTPSGAVPFDKTVTVYSNAKPSPVVLHIKGRVVVEPPTIDQLYPEVYGNLRFNFKELSLARIAQGTVRLDSFKFVNISDTPVKLTFSKLPKYLTIEQLPAELKKGETGLLLVKWNTTMAKPQLWGFVKNPLTVSINGKVQPELKLSVSAMIEDDFRHLNSADYVYEAGIMITNVVYNFNIVKQGAKVNAEYEITNTGKKPLLIRQVIAECPCIKISAPASIQPGAKAMVTVVLDTTKEEGADKIYPITLVSNAPAQTVSTLLLTGSVEK
ncbi:MAG: DUF1573 domain-containing protein [Prevotellaceae bacterium]|jgi:hypothetical protein|nr:DUF1573 domain-containing protein [Prevotellaceae bacterium]